MRQAQAKLDRRCLARSLKRNWKTFLKESVNCRRKPSAETVHQLRVASRRLLAQLEILGAIFPQVEPAKAERFLKRFRKKLGELRDTQVQKALLADWPERIPGLCALRKHLELREALLVKTAARDVKDLKFKKLRRHYAQIKEELRTHLMSPAQRDLASHFRSCADKALAQTARKLRSIDYTRPETIHRTRVAFKKFRYTLEALPDTVTGLTTKEKQRLSAYQGLMGRIQDLEVLGQLISAFEEAHPSEARAMAQSRRQLGSQQAKALAAFRRSSADLLNFWPRKP